MTCWPRLSGAELVSDLPSVIPGTEGIADVFGMVRIAGIASRDGHHLAINGSIPQTATSWLSKISEAQLRWNKAGKQAFVIGRWPGERANPDCPVLTTWQTQRAAKLRPQTNGIGGDRKPGGPVGEIDVVDHNGE